MRIITCGDLWINLVFVIIREDLKEIIERKRIKKNNA